MSEANALFTLDGCDLIIQCSKEDKMRDICQKYATKVNENLNSLLFLYGGSRINFELKFKEQANSLDIDNNKMSILVYKNEIDEFVCPKCGEKLKLDTTKIDEIISSNKNMKDQIDGIKFSIDNIIRISSVNLVNNQLKNINTVLNTIIEDINKNNEKLGKLLDEHKNNNKNDYQNKNAIKGKLGIKSNEINNKIILFNSDINNGINVYLNNKKINVIKSYKIQYKNFDEKGKYEFKLIFKKDISNLERLFEDCSNLISIDFSNFESKNVNNMSFMFNECYKLKEIKGIDKLDTSNVNNMSTMFQECYEIEYLDLSNYNTENVKDISWMFNKCHKLKLLNLLNFSINCETKNMFMFKSKSQCEFITNNKDLLNLYKSS